MFYDLYPELEGTCGQISMGQALMVSLLGLATVFACLIIIDLAVILLGKVFSSVGPKGAPKAAPAAPAAPKFDEESYAVIMAAVSEETGLPIEKFQITSIKEI